MKKVSANSKMFSRMNRKSLLLCICLILLAEIYGSVFSETIEGPGYASSTEAALAYADYFSHGDLEGMVSTFAIESYVDNINTESYAEDMTYHVLLLPSTIGVIPDEGEYLHNLNIMRRQGAVIDLFVRQCMVMANGRDIVGDLLNDKEHYDAYVSAFQNRSWPHSGSESETAAYNAQELFDLMGAPEKYQEYQEYLQRSYNRNIARYGCDDLDSVITFISFDGEFYIQFLTCAKYGDKWYLLDATANTLEWFFRLDDNNGYGVFTLYDLTRATDWTFKALTDFLTGK